MTQIIKNFDSFINENLNGISGIPEIDPSELRKSIQLLKSNILIFTNWAASQYAVPTICREYNKGKVTTINCPTLKEGDDINEKIETSEDNIIYFEEFHRLPPLILDQIMDIITTNNKHKYIASIPLEHDDDAAQKFINKFKNIKDRFDKIVICK